MSNLPFHKRFHGDAIAGYMGLSLEERGAYSTLLDYLYDRMAPLPGNMRLLAGFLDVSVRKAETVVTSLVKKGKLFYREDGQISNARFEKEASSMLSQRDHMAMIGSAGGRKAAEKRKNTSENNDGQQRPLEPRSSQLESRSQTPEARKKERKSAPSLPLENAPPPSGGVPDAGEETVSKRGTAWPADRDVPGEWLDSANARRVKVGLAAMDLRAVAEEFVTYWAGVPGAKGKKLDWKLTFENRAINARPPQAPYGRFGVVAGGQQEIEHATVNGWVTRLEIFHGKTKQPKGSWVPKWGPPPSGPGCLAPKEALDVFEQRYATQRSLLA